MNIPKKILSAYTLSYPTRLAYIWQASEYRVWTALRWWVKIKDFTSFAERGDVVTTLASKVVRLIISIIAGSYIILNVLSIIVFYDNLFFRGIHLGISILLYPVAVVLLSTPVVFVLRRINDHRSSAYISQTKNLFASHPGTVIAIAGSYGKTSMKELLFKVLSSEKKVVSTLGNQNTLHSQAKFLRTLAGDEDFIIIEFGEGAPGDIASMTDLSHPNYAFITGLAPNHLDHYKTVDKIVDDMRTLIDRVGFDATFTNADSPLLFELLGTKGRNYSSTAGFDGWTIGGVKVKVDSLNYELEKCGESIMITSHLLGEHTIGPVTVAVSFALEKGITKKSIELAISQLHPYEHRMEPRKVGNSWFIDDTYNGNIEGMRAGLSYLASIEIAGRKLYATPGLVDQGDQTESVHRELGKLIADAGPDHVYLMNNSVSEIIKSSAESSGYKGVITIVGNPLGFYSRLQDVLADGDVILCQNDWPDIYN